MRNRSILFLVTLLMATTARGKGIDYSRIPADVTGYAYIDVGGILSSHFLQQDPKADKQIRDDFTALGEHSNITVYTPKSPEDKAQVMLWVASDPEVHQRLQAAIAKAATSVTVTYGQQEIHYTSVNVSDLLGLLDLGQDDNNLPTASGAIDAKLLDPSALKEPAYIAFVGQDLIVVAEDLPSMVYELDVIDGKKPSLAQQDVQGLKIDAPAGVMVLGAGLAEGSRKKANATADKLAEAGDQPLGPDNFGSFADNIRVAHFDMGENDKEIYMDGSLEMKSADYTDQLKNLVLGLKAMVSLSQEKAKPLVDPLDIQTKGNTVLLRWSWPEAQLDELVQDVRQLKRAVDHDHASPDAAPAPATQPAN